MTDIVERLRNTPNWMREECGSWKSVMRSYDCAPFEAAVEIEKLRAALQTARRDALEDCAKWHDEVALEYKKEQLLYEAKDSWTVAYVFAQGYVINNKRAAAIRALGEKE
jgi:hypothetical protein